MEVNRKFLLQILLPGLLFTFILGILLGVLFHCGYTKSDAGLVNVDNKSDMKNTELMLQQYCECEIVDDFIRQPLQHEVFHPLKLDSLGEFQIDLKFRGFHEDDVGIIVFAGDKSELLIIIEIGLYKKKDIIIYNGTWHQLAKATATYDTKTTVTTALDEDHYDHCNSKQYGPQVKDWRSFLIKFNSFEASFQIIDITNGKLLLESIIPRNITINSYNVIKRYSFNNNLQSARSCSYYSVYEKVFNGESYTTHQVKACQDDKIIVAEEFFCKQ